MFMTACARTSGAKNQTSDRTSRTKHTLKSTTAIIAGLMLLPSVASAQSAPPANSWDYDTVLGGNVAKDVSTAGITDITVTDGNGFVEGNADIYTGHTVNVTGDNGATFAYRDNRSNIESTLNGNLNSNMKIVIIDRDGLFFGEDFNADVQSIVATTGDVAVGDIMDGAELMITNLEGSGEIVQKGQVTVAQAGLAAFVSPFVENSGVINAKMGTVALAAGETVTLDLYGDGLVEIAVEGELGDALLNNKGEIKARGGRVEMTAKAAKGTLDKIINNDGIINVSAVSVSDGGQIVLSGGDHGTIRNRGKIKTTEGGSVDIDGERFVQIERLPIPTSKPAWIKTNGGDVNITTSESVEIYDGVINAKGGDITIDNADFFHSSNSGTLRTTGTGEVSVNQNKGNLIVSLVQLFDPTFASINNAIDAIDNTGTGTNTVNIGAGTYNEAVEADVDNLVLNGANAGVSGSDARGAETVIIPNSPGIHVTADNVTIDGLTVSGGDEGILVEGADNATIINNIVTGSAAEGIYIKESNNAYVGDNYVYDVDGIGIRGRIANDLVIDDNEVEDALTGVSVEFSNRVDIINNNIHDITRVDGPYSDGIRTNGVQNLLVAGNALRNINDDGMYIADTSDFVISGNNLKNIGLASATGSAIDMAFSGGEALISGNTIVNAADNGIVARESDDDAEYNIIGNGIYNVGNDGIVVDQNAKVVKFNGVVDAGHNGIDIDRSAGALIGYNIVVGSSEDGIELSNSASSTVFYNTVRDAGAHGIYVTNSADAEVSNNGVSDIDGAGVFVRLSSDALVKGNVIRDVATGVRAEYSNRIEISKNDIRDVTKVGGSTYSDGIYVNGGSSVLINENKINRTNDEGIFVIDSTGHLQVTNNVINNTGLDINDNGNGIELIFTRGSASISGNQINAYYGSTRDYGIIVKESNNAGKTVDIYGNAVKNVGKTGIDVDQNAGVVAHNYVRNAGVDGITIRNSADAEVVYNRVTNVEGNGIFVRLSDDVEIAHNEVTFAGTGIRSEYGNRVDISDNKISDINKTDTSDADGIYVEGGRDHEVTKNKISRTNDDGIFMINTDGANVITWNVINNAGLDIDNNGNGIELVYSYGSFLVDHNAVNNVRDYGILTKNTSVSNGGFDVSNNSIYAAGLTGIQIDRNANNVVNNTVYIAGEHGIKVSYSDGVNIYDNYVYDVAKSGVFALFSDDTTIENNIIDQVGTGIRSDRGSHANITNNYIYNVNKTNTSDADGIYVESGRDHAISSNYIDRTNDDGISMVNTSGLNLIFNNSISNAGLDIDNNGNGIELAYTYGTIFTLQNEITNARDYGILSKNTGASGAHIVAFNTVNNVGLTGIEIDRNAVFVTANQVNNAGEHGIKISKSDGVSVLGNNVNDVEKSGIFVRLSNDADILGNRVNYAGTGIRSEYGDRVSIIENNIENINKTDTSDADGIYVEGGRDHNVSYNTISRTNDDGIFMINTSGANRIRGNLISNAGLDIDNNGNGIELVYSYGSATIEENRISNVRDYGILTKDTSAGSTGFDVNYNGISSVGLTGIQTDRNANNVMGNFVYGAGEHGIKVSRSNGVNISYNSIQNVEKSGVFSRLSNDANIEFNTVQLAGTGIRSEYGSRANIFYNYVTDINKTNTADADGIYVEGGYSHDISENYVDRTNDDGIFLINTYGTSVVEGNSVYNAGLDIDTLGNGIEAIYTAGNVEILNNYVSNVRDHGILVKDALASNNYFTVSGNTVQFAGEHGFFAQGTRNDSIVFTSNTLIDNGQNSGAAYARFESGQIDFGGEFDTNIFVNNTPATPAVGMQFDFVGAGIPGSDLSIVNESLGYTEFTGFNGTPNSFYVRFEDGAILSGPSTPIVIDATNVNFDGVVPSTFPGLILPLTVLQSIEDHLFDADDATVNGRGQIFVGQTPIILNFEDFLQSPAFLQGVSNAARLTINGLPPVSDPTLGGGFNNIEPAAGGDQTGNPDELANINPQAGGDDATQVTCVEDAAASLGSGSVSYSFGGSFQDSLAGAAACSINAI